MLNLCNIKTRGEKTHLHKTSNCEMPSRRLACIPISASLSNKSTIGKCGLSALCLMWIIFYPSVWAMHRKFTETAMNLQKHQQGGCSAVIPILRPSANSRVNLSMRCGSAHHPLHLECPCQLTCLGALAFAPARGLGQIAIVHPQWMPRCDLLERHSFFERHLGPL